jgi:hypothetical protein
MISIGKFRMVRLSFPLDQLSSCRKCRATETL